MAGYEKNLRQVEPYVPGEQPAGQNIVKLNTNENPYPPAPAVAEALSATEQDLLRRYPDPDATPLIRAIAERYGVRTEEVFAGIGSDDVLALAVLTFFNGPSPILFPDVSYSFYPVWAKLFGIPFETVPVDDSFAIRPEDYLRENGGIIFPNPNAPTGILLSADEAEHIIAGNPESVVIVDEAYIDFGGESALPLIRKYENLLVVRTFSKSRAMAGMRIGFAFGCETLIRHLRDVRQSFNSYPLSCTQIAAGIASIGEDAYFRARCEEITETRERSVQKLSERGFFVLPSAANFVFASHPDRPAKEIFAGLREKGVYVRYFDQPRIRNFLRITIGTDEEMNRFFAALDELIS